MKSELKNGSSLILSFLNDVYAVMSKSGCVKVDWSTVFRLYSEASGAKCLEDAGGDSEPSEPVNAGVEFFESNIKNLLM